LDLKTADGKVILWSLANEDAQDCVNIGIQRLGENNGGGSEGKRRW